MNDRERQLRDKLAQRASVDPETFDISLVQGEDRHFQIHIHVRKDMEYEALKRIDEVMTRAISHSRSPWPFYIAAAAFVFDALVLRSWTCLAWLFLAWLMMPRKCKGCGNYHR